MALIRSLKELPRSMLLAFAGKLVVLMLFSSEYQDLLFLPFVSHFLSNLDNPWQHFYTVQVDMFPYPPLMLYVLSLSYLPYHLLAGALGGSIVLQNLFFKLPVLGADLAIALVLLRMFPGKAREVTVFYVLSPVILYASYMHSQLDLLPMAVLLLSVYALTNRRVTFEYAMMDGINDTPDLAAELAAMLKPLRSPTGGTMCHVNPIPLHPVAESPYQPSTDAAAQAFQRVLERSGIPATVRLRRGIDIDAGCGQLRRRVSAMTE